MDIRNTQHTGTVHGTTKEERGFTLIEVLVALAVLMITASASLALIQQALHQQRRAKDGTVALYLAQDALEYVRARRAYNRIHDLDLTSGFVCADTCLVDTTRSLDSFVLDSCDAASGACTLLISTEGWYNHEDGTASPYSRYVTFTHHPYNVEVIATVHWTEAGTEHERSLAQHLYGM